MKTCIFCQIKDETEYLEDFIKYHISLGIDKIFLFEDRGTKSFDEYFWKMHKRGNLHGGHRSMLDFYQMNPDSVDKVKNVYGTTDESLLLEILNQP